MWNFQLVPNHGLTDRKKNLQDAVIGLEDVPYRECFPSVFGRIMGERGEPCASLPIVHWTLEGG
jgi:hypothetical protein